MSSARNAGVVQQAAQPVADRLDRQRIDEQRGVAGDLGGGGDVRRQHGRAAGHRLDHGQPEALVQRRERERRGAAVQRGQVVLGHVAEVRHAISHAEPLDERELLLVLPRLLADDDEAVRRCLRRAVMPIARISRARFFPGSRLPTLSTYGPSMP